MPGIASRLGGVWLRGCNLPRKDGRATGVFRGRTPRHLPGQSRMILSPACQEGNIYAGDRSACYPLYWRHLCQTTLIRAPSSSASLTGSTSFDSSMAKIAFIGGTGAEGLGLA